MEKISDMHQKFEVWHKNNLIDFLNFILTRYPKTLKNLLLEYDECLRGN